MLRLGKSRQAQAVHVASPPPPTWPFVKSGFRYSEVYLLFFFWFLHIPNNCIETHARLFTSSFPGSNHRHFEMPCPPPCPSVISASLQHPTLSSSRICLVVDPNNNFAYMQCHFMASSPTFPPRARTRLPDTGATSPNNRFFRPPTCAELEIGSNSSAFKPCGSVRRCSSFRQTAIKGSGRECRGGMPLCGPYSMHVCRNQTQAVGASRLWRTTVSPKSGWTKRTADDVHG